MKLFTLLEDDKKDHKLVLFEKTVKCFHVIVRITTFYGLHNDDKVIEIEIIRTNEGDDLASIIEDKKMFITLDERASLSQQTNVAKQMIDYLSEKSNDICGDFENILQLIRDFKIKHKIGLKIEYIIGDLGTFEPI